MILLRPAKRFIRLYLEVLDPKNAQKSLVFLFIGVALGWWIYVPIHELLHAAGCLIGGGEVSKLEISGLYGGRLLSRVFSFVVPESNYAGRLSGFDAHGSDWTYGLLVFFPFVLSLPGFLGLEIGARRKSSFLFALFLPLVFAPVISLTGDFLELGSLLLFQFWPGDSGAYRALISDDLFLLIKQMGSEGVPSGPHAAGFVALSLFLGAVMAWATLMLSEAFAGAVFRKQAPTGE